MTNTKNVNGLEVPMTEQEIAKRQVEDAAPPEPAPVIDQLKAIFTSVPIETQADLGPLAASVFLFISQNNPEAAKFVIARAVIPPELQALQAQMLALFPSD